MPGMSGLELVARLEALYPHPPPVILITGALRFLLSRREWCFPNPFRLPYSTTPSSAYSTENDGYAPFDQHPESRVVYGVHPGFSDL